MITGMRWLLAIVLVGCGPVAYVNQVTRNASTAVDEARAAQADKYAPYWWTRATQYLHMAREVAGHADFQGANHFGRLAADAAEKATTEAKLAAKDPSRRPLEQPDVAPAKTAAPAPAKDQP
jgi:hypothetical protein